MLGGGQDKPAWTACPPGVKITRVGGKISRDSLPPRGQGNRGWIAPRGATCPGGKINWDTGRVELLQPTGFYCKYYIKFMKNKKGGSSSRRPFHCTSVGLTAAIVPNVDNSGTQFISVGVCVRANP